MPPIPYTFQSSHHRDTRKPDSIPRRGDVHRPLSPSDILLETITHESQAAPQAQAGPLPATIISPRQHSEPLPITHSCLPSPPPRRRGVGETALLAPNSLPPTLSHVDVVRSRPAVSPGVYVVKGDGGCRRHCWVVEGRIMEMTFPTRRNSA
ncbi:hypothetical protein MN608_03003 [Microdochium nivale]|nr:hypothetical protein MN608_03003 [Microdochium nivale]